MQDYIPQPEKQFSYSPVQVSIWAALIMFGLFLKLMYWPGSALLILVCSGGLLGYNLVALLLFRGKHTINNIVTAMCGLWLLILVWGILWNGGYPYNEMGTLINVGATLVAGGVNALAYRKYIYRYS